MAFPKIQQQGTTKNGTLIGVQEVPSSNLGSPTNVFNDLRAASHLLPELIVDDFVAVSFDPVFPSRIKLHSSPDTLP
ncbi:MAG: hypothetical protein ABSC05_28615 [Candidatus Solibacter sp.]